jgi:hypothetical protein
MNLSNLLVDGVGTQPKGVQAAGSMGRQYSTRNSLSNESYQTADPHSPSTNAGHEHRRLPSLSQLDMPVSPSGSSITHLHKESTSPPMVNAEPKEVTFVHIQHDGHKARIPFRVNIGPNDTAEDITTTVRNFFGIYTNESISFEDADGKMFIPRFENFKVGGSVFVRDNTFPTQSPNIFSPGGQSTESPAKPYPMLPPASNQPRNERLISGAMSPPPARRESIGFGINKLGTPQFGSPVKLEDTDGFSDSDGASNSGSRRGVPSADVSLDNIVEGSRRKRAKFDSSVSSTVR